MASSLSRSIGRRIALSTRHSAGRVSIFAVVARFASFSNSPAAVSCKPGASALLGEAASRCYLRSTPGFGLCDEHCGLHQLRRQHLKQTRHYATRRTKLDQSSLLLSKTLMIPGHYCRVDLGLIGRATRGTRWYRSEAEVKMQYRKLFLACDVDQNNFVTMEELRKTLFRFGLNRLGESTLQRLFLQCVSKSLNGKMTKQRPAGGLEDETEEYTGPSLDFENFVEFVEHAVELKTALDREIPAGTSPLWWRKFKRELGFYRTSFSLLFEQTKSAALIVLDHGRNMSRNERRLVWIAVLDFIKVLPFAALLVAPGGSFLAPLFSKVFPSMLPSTFKVISKNKAGDNVEAVNYDKKASLSGTLADRKAAMKARRAERHARGKAAKEILDSKTREKRVAISTLEVASRILDLERELRQARRQAKSAS